MADERHSPDTLFFVVEDDFRLFERHLSWRPSGSQAETEGAYTGDVTADMAHPAFDEPVASFAYAPGELSVDVRYYWRYQAAPHTASQRALFRPPAGDPDFSQPMQPGLYAPVIQTSAAEVADTGVSEYLQDLVKMVTAAHRQGVGDLVWLSYEAKNKKGERCKVCHGSLLIAVSQYGARKLADIVPNANVFGRDFNFDKLLVRYLKKHGNEFKASYVYPCVGHYQAHSGQVFDEAGVENPGWRNGWVGEGTRRSHTPNGRTRWLLGWCERGVDWKNPIVLPEQEEDLCWITDLSMPKGWVSNEQSRKRAEKEYAKLNGKPSHARPVMPNPYITKMMTDTSANATSNTARRKRARQMNVGYGTRIFDGYPGSRQVVLEKKALSLLPSTHCNTMYSKL